MKYILTIFLLAGAGFVHPGITQENLNPLAVEKESARVVRVEATIDAPVSEIWRRFNLIRETKRQELKVSRF